MLVTIVTAPFDIEREKRVIGGVYQNIFYGLEKLHNLIIISSL